MLGPGQAPLAYWDRSTSLIAEKKKETAGTPARSARTREKKKRFLEAYARKLGNVTQACLAAGVSRRVYYDWREDPEFRQAVEEVDESQIDYAEHALRLQVMKGNIAAIIFMLKTLGKSRGYIEREERAVTIQRDVKALSDEELLHIASLPNGKNE